AADGMVPTFSAEGTRGTARQQHGVVLGISANLSLKRSVEGRIGQFDEMLGPGAPLMCGEDFDFSMRATAAGLRVLADDRPVIVHAGGVRSSGTDARRLWRRDGYSHGALIAKHLRLRNWSGAGAVAGLLGEVARDMVLSLVRWRRPFGLMMAAN